MEFCQGNNSQNLVFLHIPLTIIPLTIPRWIICVLLRPVLVFGLKACALLSVFAATTPIRVHPSASVVSKLNMRKRRADQHVPFLFPQFPPRRKHHSAASGNKVCQPRLSNDSNRGCDPAAMCAGLN